MFDCDKMAPNVNYWSCVHNQEATRHVASRSVAEQHGQPRPPVFDAAEVQCLWLHSQSRTMSTPSAKARQQRCRCPCHAWTRPAGQHDDAFPLQSSLWAGLHCKQVDFVGASCVFVWNNLGIRCVKGSRGRCTASPSRQRVPAAAASEGVRIDAFLRFPADIMAALVPLQALRCRVRDAARLHAVGARAGAGRAVRRLSTAAGLPGAIGNTPLIRLSTLSDETGCEILGKAEFMNPGGSVKDRAALYLIKDAEESGMSHTTAICSRQCTGSPPRHHAVPS